MRDSIKTYGLRKNFAVALSFIMLILACISPGYAKGLSPVDGLEIWGSREIEFNQYNFKGDFNQFVQRNPQVITDSKFEQHTRINVRGTIGDNVSINAVFDDSNDRDADENILLNIRGDDFEMALGRINLQLEDTKYVLNAKKALGIMFQKSFGRLTSTYLISRSEGIEEREQFFGQGIQQEYVLKTNPVVPGSERITIDGRELKPGVDYKMDYEGGSFQLEQELLPIESTSSIIVEYESSRDGSAFKNRIYGMRQFWKFDSDNNVGLSFVMQKDQISKDVIQSSGAKPEQLTVIGLDSNLRLPNNFAFDLEYAHSLLKQDIYENALPELSGNAYEASAGYEIGAHRFSVSKERIEPGFRTVGKRKFILLGEDSDIVGDIDQNIFRYEYAKNGMGVRTQYRDSETNLDSDPAQTAKDFRLTDINADANYKGVDLRMDWKTEKTESSLATTQMDRLDKKNFGAEYKFLHDSVKLNVERENEKKTLNPGAQNYYQSSKLEFASAGNGQFGWSVGTDLRQVDDLLTSQETEENTNHYARMNWRKGREFQSQLEYLWRRDNDILNNDIQVASSSSLDIKYMPNRNLNYFGKLKQEIKRRVIQETSRVDLAELLEQQKQQTKTYLTLLNPVQTLVTSHQLKLRQGKNVYHRVSYRSREEKEQVVENTLNSNENYSYDLKWDLPYDFRLRYRWDKSDRFNGSSQLDKTSIGTDYELSRELGGGLKLSGLYNTNVEQDFYQKNILDEDESGMKLEKSFGYEWKATSSLTQIRKNGREDKDEILLGAGMIYTPQSSDLRLGLEMSQGTSEDHNTDANSSVKTYKIDVQKQIFKEAFLEGSYKYEQEAPGSEGAGFKGSIYHLKVSMDF